MSLFRLAVAIATFFAYCPLAFAAPERVALIIGMADYGSISKLRNTSRDAQLISEKLTDIGFNVTTVVDRPKAEVLEAMADFAFRSETADLAMIYYAGHGVSVEGKNFLIPIDANIKSNADLFDQAIELNQLLETVDKARKMRIVVLDACRNNPFGGGLSDNAGSGPRQVAAVPDTAQTPAATDEQASRGLAASGGMGVPSPERGTLVAYAARDGSTALDGNGDNSPFATALAEKIVQPGLEISLMFRQVRDEVMRSTQNKQEPNTYGSLPGVPFYLAGSSEQFQDLAAGNPAEAWSRIRPDQEAQMLEMANAGDARALLGMAYIRLYPNSPSYNAEEGAAFLTKAVAKGSPEAEFELARLYEKGIGVAPDQAKAIELYKSAAAQNFPDAINEIGYFMFTGSLGFPVDQMGALQEFRRAADLGQAEAQFNVASFIDDGHIPDAGPEQAAEYLYRGIRGGSDKVLEALSLQSDSFKSETRIALQGLLKDNGFYSGKLDGSFGKGTVKSLRKAFGLID